MASITIFISSAHEDEFWRQRLVDYLRVVERQTSLDVWDTALILAGHDWADAVAEGIRRADLALLLVSPSFLASDVIVNRELPVLLSRQQEEGIPVLAVQVRPTSWSSRPEIAQFQFANDPSRPLSDVSQVEQERVFNAIARLVSEVAQAKVERDHPAGRAHDERAAAEVPPPFAGDAADGHLFVSHSREDGDFAELLKLRLDRVGYDAWVDTDRLMPGLDWRLEIDGAIRSARAVIAVMSPDARASEYVTYEWAYAWGCGVHVIPIMLRQTPLHPRLGTLQYLDFTNRVARPWTRLFDVLAGLP